MGAQPLKPHQQTLTYVLRSLPSMQKFFATHATVRADSEAFSSSLQQRMLELSQDAQAVAPAEQAATSFVGSTDDQVAAALNERLGMSASASSDEDGAGVPSVAPDAALTRAPPTPAPQFTSRAWPCL